MPPAVPRTLRISPLDDTLASVLTKLGTAAGGTATLVGGAIKIDGNTGADLIIGGSAAGGFGLTANTYARTNAAPTPAPITLATKLAAPATPASDGLAAAMTTTDTITINNKTIHFYDTGAGGSAPASPCSATHYLDLANSTVGSLKTAIDTLSGGTSTFAGGAFTLKTGTGADIVTLAAPAWPRSAWPAGTIQRTSAPATAAQITGATALKGAVGTNSLTSSFNSTDTITVNGKTIAFFDASLGESAGIAANTSYIDIATATVDDVLAQIDIYSGGTNSAVNGGKVTLNAGTTADLTIGGSGLAKLGLVAGTTPAQHPRQPRPVGQDADDRMRPAAASRPTSPSAPVPVRSPT